MFHSWKREDSEPKPSPSDTPPSVPLQPIVRQIQEAMAVLSQASCGAIGPNGATMEEMQEVWENGGTYGDDAYYDTCQHAWRLLETAVAMSNPTLHPPGCSAAEPR